MNITRANEAFLFDSVSKELRLYENLDYDKLDFENGTYTFKNQKWLVNHRVTLTGRHYSVHVEFSL